MTYSDKKILIIINNLGIGGAERLVIDDINEMIKLGINVKLITLKSEKKATLKDGLFLDQKNWLPIPFNGFYDIKHWLDLIKEIKRYKPAVVFTHLWFGTIVGVLASYFARVPLIISFEHGIPHLRKKLKNFLVELISHFFSDKIIAVSQDTKKELMRYHGVKENKIKVVINGIDIEKFSKALPSDVREEYGLKDEFIFLSVGSLRSKQKNFDTLIRALALTEKGVLVIAGDGVEMPNLKKLANDLKVQERVYFLGNRKDIPQLLKSADCFVLVSRYESLGIVVLEAMAAGKPIIVSNFGPSKEMIENERNGLFVPINDIRALSNALKRIEEEPELRYCLAQEAEKDSVRFSVQNHVSSLLGQSFNDMNVLK